MLKVNFMLPVVIARMLANTSAYQATSLTALVALQGTSSCCRLLLLLAAAATAAAGEQTSAGAGESESPGAVPCG